MKFVISNRDKVAKFLAITKNMKQMIHDVNFGICEKEIYAQGMDSSHVGLFELKLQKEWFDEWKGPNEFHYNVGINCEALSRIMSCHSVGQYIEFSFMENSTEELIIKFEGLGHDKMFELKLVDIDTELMDIPEVEYDADIIMSSKEFNNIMAESEMFGDTLSIELGIDDYIYMVTGGDGGIMRVRIKEEDIVEYAITEDVNIKHSYGLKHCLLYSKFAKINKNVSLHLKDETPLKIKYDMSHWIDDNCNKQVVGEDDEAESKNYFGFYLAPKIDNEED